MELIYNGYDDELLNDINIIQDDTAIVVFWKDVLFKGIC